MKILSWNVNGLRAVYKKGFENFLDQVAPDVLCIQEIKVQEHQLSNEQLHPQNYETVIFNPATRKGYSGTATYIKNNGKLFSLGFGEEKFDNEGRVIITLHQDILLYNVYFPNGTGSEERLQYKFEFYDALLEHIDFQRNNNKKKVIICGDFNIAHKSIDLARPKSNAKRSGFLPEERKLIDKYLDYGFIDSFRHFSPDVPEQYSWWDYRFHSRDRNVGWRIDYFLVDKKLIANLKSAFIMPDIFGSDHCPVGIEIQFD